jgi:hypothetical protein
VSAWFADTIADSSGRYLLCGLPTDHLFGVGGFGGPVPGWYGNDRVDPGGDAVIDLQLVTCKPEDYC